MTCPVCGGKTLITYSFGDCETNYRERTCKECEYVFHTSESEFDSKEYQKLIYRRNRQYQLQKRGSAV